MSIPIYFQAYRLALHRSPIICLAMVRLSSLVIRPLIAAKNVSNMNLIYYANVSWNLPFLAIVVNGCWDSHDRTAAMQSRRPIHCAIARVNKFETEHTIREKVRRCFRIRESFMRDDNIFHSTYYVAATSRWRLWPCLWILKRIRRNNGVNRDTERTMRVMGG